MLDSDHIPLPQLIFFNSIGLIPGPFETSADFIKRVDYALTLKELVVHLPLLKFDRHLVEVAQVSVDIYGQLERRYDYFPNWMPILFSNDQLNFWHGGSLVIFQEDKHSPRGAFIQLRKKFSTSDTYLKLYTKHELLLHELTHAGRLMFNEPTFEEMLTYRTSPSAFRAWFGPLIQTSNETLIFVIGLSLILMSDLFLIISTNHTFYIYFQALKMLPIALISYGLYRLWRRHAVFNQALAQIKSAIKDRLKADAVIYRLTDQEIYNFATLDACQIRQYGLIQAQKELRWRLIFNIYF